MRFLVVEFVKTYVPKGMVIKLQSLYAGLYSQFPKQCQDLGFTNSAPIEPKWKNEIRYGVWEARKLGLIKHVGTPRSGEWQRL